MEFETYQKDDCDQRVYKLTISGGELLIARLDRFDHALLRECGGPDAAISDALLGLEMLTRRIEQAESKAA